MSTINIFRWSSSILNSEPSSDVIQLEELSTMSLYDSVWQVEKSSIIYQHQLSTLGSKENRAVVIIYYHISIPSGINLDCCSMHPTIMEIDKKKQFQCNGGLNLCPCPWDINLVIYWLTDNLSYQGWAKNKSSFFENRIFLVLSLHCTFNFVRKVYLSLFQLQFCVQQLN